LFQTHESGSVSDSLVLTESKNNNFTIIGGTKINHGPSSRDTSLTQRPSIKIFFKPKIYWKLGYFWKACIVSFQKNNICLNKKLETSELFNIIRFESSNFQQISALVPNFTRKFKKFCAVILIIQSTTNNDSKTISCIEIYPLDLKISLILCQKTCEIGWKSDVDFSRFHTFFDIQLKISSDSVDRFWCKITFWKRYLL
jgi:hypothetical protein